MKRAQGTRAQVALVDSPQSTVDRGPWTIGHRQEARGEKCMAHGAGRIEILLNTQYSIPNTQYELIAQQETRYDTGIYRQT